MVTWQQRTKVQPSNVNSVKLATGVFWKGISEQGGTNQKGPLKQLPYYRSDLDFFYFVIPLTNLC